ncbi:putative DNA-binding transcriptional regulator YafY [Paenibacillus forsythiae]|uniref:DNA-binding transcriptional regulator YafY n=1 Tax=Paenibacillus forsythiae TaxID=365616 RepID=A0ABU3HCI7_9BACL|nr:YafY family protein [Paenibacillus forsythiae]MDT3428511.1 putative DNA-binding transcriptional regulator YafY [Paenibacillus forsythiae]
MKIDRLLSIVIVLLGRRLVQAKELADMFEVSVRTIYRDIETLGQAGIPVVTYQGGGGGIGLIEGYRLDRNVLTEGELAQIFSALRSLSPITGGHERLMEKINSVVPPSRSRQFRSIASRQVVDFSPWGLPGASEQKLALIKEALEESVTVSFAYVSAEGTATARCVEPYTLVMKGQSWYLYGYCRLREDFRLFKLPRMKDVVKGAEVFTRLELSFGDWPWNDYPGERESLTEIILHFAAGDKHIAEERFDCSELQADGSGGYTVALRYPVDEWLYGFLLSLGPAAEVLEPEHVRQRLGERAAAVACKYHSGNLT